MTPLETILAFLAVMGLIAVPIVGLLTRKNSAIGQAIGRRIADARSGDHEDAASADRRLAELVERQQQQAEEIHSLREKIDFIGRLLEHQDEPRNGGGVSPR